MTSATARLAALLFLGFTLAACSKDSTVPITVVPPEEPRITSLEVTPSSIVFNTPGDSLTVSVRVLDQFGHTYTGPGDLTVNTSSTDSTVAVVRGASVLGGFPGNTIVSVRVATVVQQVPVTVAPWPVDPQWSLLASSPVSISLHFQDASFISPREGFVVSLQGQVEHTADGGATWDERRPADLATSLTHIFRATAFVSPDHGYIGDIGLTNATSGPVLWETVDGGRNWTNIKDRIVGFMPVGLCGMDVIDSSTIVAVGRWNGPAVFVRTNDGGRSWSSVSLAPLATGAVDVHFFDRLNGIIVAGRGVGNSPQEQESSRVVILGTTDGGATWQERYLGTAPGLWSWKISFPSRNVGYVATQGPAATGLVLKTIDGGLTWTALQVTPPSVPGSFWGIGFATPTRGWVARTRSNDARDVFNDLYETNDGGATWVRRRWSQGLSVNRFRFMPDGSAYAIGKRVFKFVP